MDRLDFSGGFDLLLAGKPEKKIEKLSAPARIAVSAIDLKGLKPLIRVEEGAKVNAGDTLFVHKNDERIKVIAPVNGKVLEIRRGPRRLLLEVILEVSPDQPKKHFETLKIESASEESIVNYLLSTGSWPFIRQLPFNVIADAEKRPRDIYVSLLETEPLCPDLNFVLQDKSSELQKGVRLLQKLTKGNIFVTVGPSEDQDTPKSLLGLQGVRYLKAKAHYPAGSPRLQNYYAGPLRKNEVAWYIHPQDLIALVNLMETGRLDSMRTFTVAGSALKNRRYVQAMIGSPVEAMVQGEALGADVRCIAGGVLTGTKIESGYMGFYAHSLQVIPEGYQREFLRFMQPGFDRFSYSKVFLSNLFGPQEYPMTTSIQGEDRACVQCAACEDVCPVEILPQFLFKAALAEDYDNLDQLGIKDCVECGLCTFVCPSKIDIDGILKVTLAQIAKEG